MEIEIPAQAMPLKTDPGPEKSDGIDFIYSSNVQGTYQRSTRSPPLNSPISARLHIKPAPQQ
jgi:hypothetical protein